MHRTPRTFRIALALLSGFMLGFSFPPFETGMLAAAAFVPFFILAEDLDDYPEVFCYSYVLFFVFNAITLYWTGGFTQGKDIYLMMAGAMLVIVHPVFFCIPVLLWWVFRKQYGWKKALIVFPLFWIAFEYLHAHGQMAFPWLILGNTQTYNLELIQFTTVTGAYGLSLWLLSLNVMFYVLYVELSLKAWTPASPAALLTIAAIVMLYLAPKFYGAQAIGAPPPSPARDLRVGVVQPNIDPFEKWSGRPDDKLRILEHLTRKLTREHVDLVVWPETAINFYIRLPVYRNYFEDIKRMIDTAEIHLLTGIVDIAYYQAGAHIPHSSKTSSDGRRYDTYNSSMLLDPHSDLIQTYAKMQLVPFAERVPFSEQLSFLNAMQWNFGMGGWNFGKTPTIFHFSTADLTDVTFSNLICYESAFPGFVADFVKNGAQFLVVMTNDSWWGNTSGAYQHKQIAVLRAVENRRWVVQCANGGISCFIDPYGHILQPTSLYSQTVLSSSIAPRKDLTFYTRHGDWLAEFCAMFSLFFLASALGKKFYVHIRTRQTHETN